MKQRKDSGQVTTDHENDHSAEQNSNAQQSNPAKQEAGQNHVNGGDPHESILINVNENSDSISASNAISECR